MQLFKNYDVFEAHPIYQNSTISDNIAHFLQEYRATVFLFKNNGYCLAQFCI